MQEYNGFKIVYREMIEDKEGLFVGDTPMAFQTLNSIGTEGEEYLMLLQEAADAWVCWMQSQDHEVFELPRTTRTREWGLTFSVTAQGRESRIFVVSGEE